MQSPPIVSAQQWEAAWEKALIKEKELQHARDALAALRRRFPWMAVEKHYAFDGRDGKVSLLDLFDARRQLIVYRAFIEPGTGGDDVPGLPGWPEHGCVGCSLMADHIGQLGHLNARDTTLVYVSRAAQTDLDRMKTKMGWGPHPLVQHHRRLRQRLRRQGLSRHQRVHPRRRPGVPHLFHQRPRGRGVRQYLELPRHDSAWAPRELGGFTGGLSADPAV